MNPLTWISLGISITMTIALYFLGNAYLDKRDEARDLIFAAQITDLTIKHKKEMESAVNDVIEEYTWEADLIDKEHKEKENDWTRQIMAANKNAAQNSIEFGDDLVRDLIRVDCLWSKGEAGNSVQERAACSDEAANADPSSTGFYYTVFTPQFLRSWYEACDAYPDGSVEDYFLPDWEKEYPKFTQEICEDTLAALPPDTSKFISKLISNGEGYSSRLINYAVSLNKIIDVLTKRIESE